MPSPASPFALTCFGAAGEVTGSCSLLETPAGRVLVDFGLFQGSRESEWRNVDPPLLDFASLAAVIVTHAHVDHCGRLPMLPRLGFRGPIFCTEGTADLLPRVLRGSARLQKVRLEEHQRGTWPEAVPFWLGPDDDPKSLPPTPAPAEPPFLYRADEVEAALRMLRPLPLGKRGAIGRGLAVRFGHAGHVVGAAHAIVELEGRPRPIAVFSGDLGSPHTGLLRAADPPPPCELLVLESTRGDRLIADAPDPDRDLAEVLDEVRREEGTLLVPTFALGRGQQIVWRLATAARRGHLEGLTVYLDAPMAEFALRRLRDRPQDLAPALRHQIERGGDPFAVTGMRALFSRKQSLEIAARRASVIIAGAGFCDAGPILHHLAEGLPRADVRVAMSGWYPEGGLGRGLIDGCTHARIDRKVVPVRASIRRLEGYSGHASAEELVEWAGSGSEPPGRIALNHGTDSSREALASRLRSSDREVLMPAPDETIVFGDG
ncbi:MAG: MBL fold metallo-hydrolase RNA specificity domain-containing protein [Phycisphaerales bacterium]